MKPINPIFIVFLMVAFPSFSQIKVTILNQTDSLCVMGVICTDQQNHILSASDSKGNLSLAKNGNYILVHPSFYAVKMDRLKNDTLVYLQPLVKEIEEVEIVSTTNEKLFNLVIQQYRHDLENSTRKGTLNYKNTNWFTYDYLEEQKRDSAYCAIENTLAFEVEQTKKKSKILFSPIALNRYCSAFSFPENADIKTAEMPGFSKSDFSRFINALFTEKSFFDEIGFTHTQSTKRIDEQNKTIELKFLTDGYEKNLVFSAIDSSLLSYRFQFSGKQGWYHVYFATFSGQEVQTFYEEKAYLFDYEKQNHLFHSVHYGNFQTNEKIQATTLKPFAEIIKDQSTQNSTTEIEPLYPRHRNCLIQSN